METPLIFPKLLGLARRGAVPVKISTSWHIRVETPIALHSVAHRVLHQIPAESEMSRQNRATPPQIKVSHLSPDPPVALSSDPPVALSSDPPVALSSHSQQAGGAAGWWRVSQHFWVPKTDGATGGYRSYSHTSRATLCN